jgi:antitoxin component YwqK of YwqJK toxin-antitoxin module
LNDEMQGEWFFYDQVEQLIQIWNFKDNLKHGIWLRFDKNWNEEYKEEFENGKIVKK